MKFLNLVCALFMMGLIITSCSKDDDPTPPVEEKNTIADVVKQNSDFSSLLTALEKADLASVLSGTTKYTVFAPKNDAFASFLSANGFPTLDDVPVATLKQILLNHVVSGEAKAATLSTGYISSLAEEATTSNPVSLYINTDDGVVINGDVKVTSADVAADNGVIHIVDKVIGLPTVVTFATSNSAFSTLVAALTRPSFGTTYVDLLSGDENSPFTVFAPTNDAFANLLTTLGATSLDDVDDATLQAVLNYHVIAGANVVSSALVDGSTPTTFQGETLTVDLSSGAAFIDGTGMPAKVAVADVQAANGIIHAVDKVLLPKSIYDAINPTIAGFVSMNSDYSSLLAAVVKAGLADVLSSDDSDLTVLAPNNASFAKFLSAKGFASLDDVPVEALKQILLNHVIAGSVLSDALATGYGNTLATNADGDNISLYINTENGVSFNGGADNKGASVSTADIKVRNGVIHAIDNVIDLPTVVNFAVADPTFSVLVAALTRDDLDFDFVGTLSATSSPAPYTVFAPTDAAFVDLLGELNASALGDIDKATLDAVLRYHVVTEANVRVEDLSDDMDVKTFNGASFNVNMPSGDTPFIMDTKERKSNIVVTNVQAANGVIHVLDKVILP